MSTILVVDDNPTTQMTLKGMLHNDDCTLAFADNGLKALEQAKAVRPDLILLDIMMPGIDGFEVCQQIRATPVLAEVPIIFITSLDDCDTRRRGLAVGGDDFIPKPFNRIELQARVRLVLRLNRYRRLLEDHCEA